MTYYRMVLRRLSDWQLVTGSELFDDIAQAEKW